MEHKHKINAASNFRTERPGHLINEYTTIHMSYAGSGKESNNYAECF